MPHFSCAGGCTNSSDANEDISFHSLPLNDKKRLNVWITKMKRDPKYFSITMKIQKQYYCIIIDATEINIQVPSFLQKQSERYSNYKGHTTLKCLIGVDPRGGVMFVSQLYGGPLAIRRSGFLEILKQKLQSSEILPGDTIMADKGVDIDEELKELGLCLNIPPYLKEKNCLSESDVIRTQTIAMHRIHVERAIRKIK